MKKTVTSIILILLLHSCGSGVKKTEQRDITLVIPGISAEGFILNEPVISEKNITEIETSSLPDSLSSMTAKGYIPVFRFNRILYLRGRYALFTDNGIISAIAGLSPSDRGTDDAFRLSEGVDSFIMNYGNQGLKIADDGEHRTYFYKKMGIALFDDNSDDSIDMYLIFPPEK